MANRDAPFGLRPAFHLCGGAIRPAMGYTIASGLNNAIGFGDLVFMVATSDNKNIDSLDDAGANPAVIVGVFAGCSYQDTDGNMQYRRNWVAGTATLGSVDADAYVYDDPWIVYDIQGDGTGAVTDVHKTADIVYAEPDSVSGQSRTELDTSNIGTGLHLFIYGWRDDPNLVKTGANPQYQVMINEHAFRNAGSTSFAVLA